MTTLAVQYPSAATAQGSLLVHRATTEEATAPVMSGSMTGTAQLGFRLVATSTAKPQVTAFGHQYPSAATAQELLLVRPTTTAPAAMPVMSGSTTGPTALGFRLVATSTAKPQVTSLAHQYPSAATAQGSLLVRPTMTKMDGTLVMSGSTTGPTVLGFRLVATSTAKPQMTTPACQYPSSATAQGSLLVHRATTEEAATLVMSGSMTGTAQLGFSLVATSTAKPQMTTPACQWHFLVYRLGYVLLLSARPTMTAVPTVPVM